MERALFALLYLGVFCLPAVGKTFPADLFGNFTQIDDSNPSRCPKFITQTTFTEGSIPDSWNMPHNTIFHGDNLCNSFADERKTVYYNNSLVPDQVPEEVNTMLREHGPNIEINYPLNDNAIHDGENYYIGYDQVTRFCQDGSKFNNGTIYFLFRPFLPVHMPLSSKQITFYPEWKYLIAVPRYSKHVCMYRAYVPGTESEQIVKSPVIEVMESTPTPEETPYEFEAMIPDTFSSVNSEGAAPTVFPEEEEESKPSCFPGVAYVQLQNGSHVLLKNLVVGDVIRTSSNSYSKVFMFTHQEFDTLHKFIRMKTVKGTVLHISHGHYIYVDNKAMPAKFVQVGDILETVTGKEQIIALDEVLMQGLYNPQTIDGDIMVNGIKTSTYTTAFDPMCAHASLSFLRAVFKWSGLSASLTEREESIRKYITRYMVRSRRVKTNRFHF